MIVSAGPTVSWKSLMKESKAAGQEKDKPVTERLQVLLAVPNKVAVQRAVASLQLLMGKRVDCQFDALLSKCTDASGLSIMSKFSRICIHRPSGNPSIHRHSSPDARNESCSTSSCNRFPRYLLFSRAYSLISCSISAKPRIWSSSCALIPPNITKDALLFSGWSSWPL